MDRSRRSTHRHREGQRGQILVVAVLAMIAMIGGVALILEGGNAYAQQRVVQNGADAVANVGATTLGQKLGGATRTDAQVAAAMTALSGSNALDSYNAYYTDWQGHLLTASGTLAPNTASAANVGGGTIPANGQGVQVGASKAFGTTFGRVIGFSQFVASAEATAVAGALTGGEILPVVFPVNIVDCSVNGDVGTGEANWTISNPGSPPVGQEYIVPLCKTGGGSFMVLDLDGTPNNCDQEVANPPAVQFAGFPVDIASDNGNNCAKPITDYVNANLRYHTVLIPICDNTVGDPCGTQGGSHAQYRITRVTAFFIDYMDDSNNRNNSNCQSHVSGTGQQLVTIAGNGSSSCIAGWFVRYFKTGPVGSGTIGNTDAVGVQLIR
jgi:Flp pilus assembly protein TadG